MSYPRRNAIEFHRQIDVINCGANDGSSHGWTVTDGKHSTVVRRETNTHFKHDRRVDLLIPDPAIQGVFQGLHASDWPGFHQSTKN